MVRIQWGLVLGMALFLGCAAPSLESRRDAAQTALSALQKGRFDEAEKEAKAQAERDAGNPYARLVKAIVRYEKTMNQLVKDGRTVLIGGLDSGNVNQKYLGEALRKAESELAEVEADLAVVAQEPKIDVELCIACWKIDWDGNGRINERDMRLPQIEVDENGEEIPEDDPRRTPTFHFDEGDVAWARAFVSFQRAGLDLLLAYDWSDVGMLAGRFDEMPDQIVIKLVDAGKVAEAKTRILEGLAFSDASRKMYLAETDDDREWVPNPRQKSHPMPLPVDEDLYATWEEVVKDLKAIVEGREGVSVKELMTLAGERPHKPVRGYLDIGKMLAHPKDIVLDIRALDRLEEEKDIEGGLSSVFGEYYVRSMKASLLPTRLLRMKDEIDRTEGEFDRKLRYLFWLN